MLLGWLATKDRNCQTNRELDIIDGRLPGYDVRLFALDEILDLLLRLRTVEKNLCQGEVMREPLDIVRNNNVQPALRSVDVTDLQDLHVVPKHIIRHLERRDVNYLDVGIA